ncbi:glycosyltransferase [Dyadobacter tibetensis]|uniref:glycosyltransferase n=1 Tax=Dyadobacter tibetensis TaxID=1211851 RepID=UPI0004714068|nr:glycosyltransferase [Dyadobacter tibetensis]
MKIAIVQDELIRRAGGEQVGLCFHKAFPEADFYTSTYNPETTFAEFKQIKVRTSWFTKIAQTEKRLKALFFPFGIMAMKQLDLRAYDIVLISGTNFGKYVKISPDALVITYCYTPFRLAWNPTSYSEYERSTGLKRLAFDTVIKILKKIDFKEAQRTNWFLAMTEETKERLQRAYKPKSPITIIPPPVNTANFNLLPKIGDYYLLVSRLEYYKKVDLAIEAFNELGYKLIVVGKGSKGEELKAIAKDNIEFRSGISKEELGQLYAGCKAFIFPQHEDYGITPLEANASGRPVIGYSVGGILTTQIPCGEDGKNATSIFFDDQTAPSLCEAVNKMEKIIDSFDPNFIRAHAEKFDDEVFIKRIKSFVLQKYADFRKI